MTKLNVSNYKLATWILVLLVIGLLLVFGAKTNGFNDFQIDWSNLIFELGIAIIISLIASFLIGFIAFKEQFNEQLKVLNISRNLVRAGIIDYYDEWDNSRISKEIEKSKDVEIYIVYGSTLINTINTILRKKLQENDFEISFYLMDPENPFVESYGNLWGKYDVKYLPKGISKKISSSIEEIRTLKEDLELKD